ncbi:Adenylyltransferase and sulfurtransferase MOCS3 [Larimichthys crocea]|uniref:Uncharacterized protein n=1 Tax=Larimichthys crocea TaxID=215358 RepID=A0ACD3RP04_LARCR|nr:Adenylyltransferase and sulfurtransferase MOCS3 [Larimichthys crocea]
MAQEVCSLKAQLQEKEREIAALKEKLAQLEKSHNSVELHDKVTPLTPLKAKAALSNEDIMRYSRQLLLPELGVQGQLNLSKTSVLIVGCGGLGCPLAQYLAAAGIGRLGLLDYDEVELSNLHRQVLHGEENQGMAKALSAANAVNSGSGAFQKSGLFLDRGVAASCGQQLVMFDAQDARFRSIKLRPKQADCVVCGENPSITQLVDYEAFCGAAATDKCRKLNLLSRDQRITVQDYKAVIDHAEPHLLLDVRPLVEVDICHLPFSLNIPLSSLEARKSEHIRLLQERISQLKQQMAGDCRPPVYIICKLGNDSQKAVQVLEKMSGSEVDVITVKDICGGLMAWANRIDGTFPQY